MSPQIRKSSLRAAALTTFAALALTLPRSLRAQVGNACATDRTISTVVGAGLGAAVGAIPATIVHRHDPTSSHQIVVLSIASGALLGFVGAGRDHPCALHADSSRVGGAVIAGRSKHAGRGAVAGAVVGGVLGAVGSTFYNVGCAGGPCGTNKTRLGLMLFSSAEGAVAGGLVGGLVGWVWPAGRP